MNTLVLIISKEHPLKETDISVEEAPMDLGARPMKTFFLITLPGIAPALAAAWLLSFTLSLDDLVIASFVSGPGSTTLPMVVFSSVRMGVSPQINALASLIILAVSLAAFIAWWLMRRAEKRRLQQLAADMEELAPYKKSGSDIATRKTVRSVVVSTDKEAEPA